MELSENAHQTRGIWKHRLGILVQTENILKTELQFRWRRDNQLISLTEFSSNTNPKWAVNKLLDVSFLCVCPDHEFRIYNVKVVVDPQASLTMLWRNSLSITGQTHKNLHQFVFYDNKFSSFPLSLADASHEFQIHVSVRILTIKISQWASVNFCSYRKISDCCVFTFFGRSVEGKHTMHFQNETSIFKNF